jgi:hypothetical protein
MDALRGEFTIATNRFDMLKLDWDPDMWILADVAENDTYWNFDEMLSRDSTFFFRDHDRPFIEPLNRPNVIFMERCTHNGPAPVPGGDPWDPRIPLEWHLPLPCEYGGGISIAIQAAASLGKNPIYLLGCDLYEYRGPDDVDINHFHPDYCEYKIKHGKELVNPWAWELLNLRLIKGHEIARDSAANMGITIYNATVGGKLEVYERVNINEVLNERPV